MTLNSCKPGDRIRLLVMPNDPDPILAGTTGTVLEVTEGLLGQITVHWDNRRSLILIPEVDQFEIIGHSGLVAECFGCPGCHNRAMDLLTWDIDCEHVTCSLCGATYTP